MQARGAQGVVIYDAAGLCSSSGFDQRCVPGANRHFDEGFAAADVPDYWLVCMFWCDADVNICFLSLQYMSISTVSI